MQALAPPRILLSGDAAVTVEFGKRIDAAANSRVLALDHAIAEAQLDWVKETVPTYRSLLVHYDPLTITFDQLSETLFDLAKRPSQATSEICHWRIPVVYGDEFGIDLEDVARTHNTTADEIIRRHTESDYRVAMLGFMPGFSYLSGLSPSLETPRRQSPRTMTPTGTISIGGTQAGVQCLASPSGWHLLGRTPVRTFQIDRDPVFLLRPGDAITFYAIDAKEFADRDQAASSGELVAEQVSV